MELAKNFVIDEKETTITSLDKHDDHTKVDDDFKKSQAETAKKPSTSNAETGFSVVNNFYSFSVEPSRTQRNKTKKMG